MKPAGNESAPAGYHYRLVPLSELGEAKPPDWVWRPYIAAGAVTLLSAVFKAGKTTLLTHLLADLRRGEGLVDAPSDAPVVVVSEESSGFWARRRDEHDLPDTVLLVDRGTFAKPDLLTWRRMLEDVRRDVEARGIRLLVLDTFAAVGPVTDENDAGAMLEALGPVRDVAEAGCGVLLVHHTRKSGGEEGRGARGSGALPGFADILLELRRADPEDAASTQRILRAWSRFEDTPGEVVLDYTEAGYQVLGDRATVKRDDELEIIESILTEADGPLTSAEVRDRWPDTPRIGERKLRGHLNWGASNGRWTRCGTGVRGDAYGYSFPATHTLGGGQENMNWEAGS